MNKNNKKGNVGIMERIHQFKKRCIKEGVKPPFFMNVTRLEKESILHSQWGVLQPLIRLKTQDFEIDKISIMKFPGVLGKIDNVVLIETFFEEYHTMLTKLFMTDPETGEFLKVASEIKTSPKTSSYSFVTVNDRTGTKWKHTIKTEEV